MPADSPARSVCFVIPTYNEAENVTALLDALTALHPGPEAAFLVVDDRSPDGTGRLVREFARRDPRVRLLEGPRRGLGAAYARGIGWCLGELAPAAVVCMDADFQHDPADARRLLGRLAGGADVAIGSRYVPGGALDEDWGRGRRLLSAWGNRLARRLAGLGEVRDCTSGYRAIRADALRAADAAGLRARGYAFQIALLHRLARGRRAGSGGADPLPQPRAGRDQARRPRPGRVPVVGRPAAPRRPRRAPPRPPRELTAGRRARSGAGVRRAGRAARRRGYAGGCAAPSGRRPRPR